MAVVPERRAQEELPELLAQLRHEMGFMRPGPCGIVRPTCETLPCEPARRLRAPLAARLETAIDLATGGGDE